MKNRYILLISLCLTFFCYQKANSQLILITDSIFESRCAATGIVHTHTTGGNLPYSYRYKFKELQTLATPLH